MHNIAYKGVITLGNLQSTLLGKKLGKGVIGRFIWRGPLYKILRLGLLIVKTSANKEGYD
jgi:hypothetical protein